jgi:hypothetical protein
MPQKSEDTVHILEGKATLFKRPLSPCWHVRYKVHENQMIYRILQLLRFVPSKYIKSERWLKMQRYLQMRNQDTQLMMNANGVYLLHYFLMRCSGFRFKVSNPVKP